MGHVELTDKDLLSRYDDLYREFELKLRELFAEHGPRLHRLLAEEMSCGKRSALRSLVPSSALSAPSTERDCATPDPHQQAA